MTEKPVKCKQCKVIMDRIEVHDEVVVGYNWNYDTKEYEEADQDWCGNVEVKYECPGCKEIIIES
jgi:hypothetical protein